MLDLTGVKRIGLDTETTGLDRHGDDRAVGVSIASAKGDAYYAFGHPSANNTDRKSLRKWFRQMKGVEVALVNPSLDLHMLKKEGIDLEHIGAKPVGVQYRCALIDEKRRHYDLDAMASDFLKQKKSEKPCKPEDIHKMPGDMIEPYAKRDARLTLDLADHFEPTITKQSLNRVAQLEDDLIYAVLHMELQGTHLDMDKMRRWDGEVAIEVQKRQHAIKGVNPRSNKQMEDAFRSFGFHDFTYTEKGNPQFDKNAIKGYRIYCNKRGQEFCDKALALKAIETLKGNYLEKYLEESRDGILRYNLHQCRTNDNGTVSGRFSASGVNIQQVSAEEKQDAATLRWIIRELFLPEPGAQWLSADASQIEFRLFAHYANAQAIIEAFARDPWVDYHQAVADMIGLIRKLAKNVNFGMVYGMGRKKLARDLQMTDDEADDFFIGYHAKFPEAQQLMDLCMKVARDRGYVKTLLGRRRRFEDRKMLHSALNAVLQGSAADIMKTKIVLLYREMKHLDFNLRFTVHDEVDGDLYNPERAKDVAALLNEQTFDLRVPILWKTKTGQTWREAA